MSHPPTRSSLEGSGRRARPCHLPRLPLITASHASGLWPQPPGPLPSLDVQACPLPARGPAPPSSWTFGFFCLDCHMHIPAQTQPYAHAYACKSTCTHTHPTCTHACVHTHVCPHMHSHVHTHTHTHMHCSFPWPSGPQPGACSPAGLRPSTAPTVAPTPTPSSFLHTPGESSAVTAGVASSELGPGARVGLWALVPWAEGGPLSARGWDRPWPPS